MARGTFKPTASAPEGPWQLDLESYGVPYSVATDSRECLRRWTRYLPPGSRLAPSSAAASDALQVRSQPGSHRLLLLRGGETLKEGRPIDVLYALGAALRHQVASSAEPWVFVHAGVVAWGGRAVVMPGKSYSGKTRLVAALLRLGATYYSDEFAVLDPEGSVHPFPKPLSLRRGTARRGSLRTPESLGASVGAAPLPLGLVVQTAFLADRVWQPRPLTRGEVILALVGHTVSARSRPAQMLASVVRSSATAVGVAGVRGDAGEAAEAILELLERQVPSPTRRAS